MNLELAFLEHRCRVRKLLDIVDFVVLKYGPILKYNN